METIFFNLSIGESLLKLIQDRIYYILIVSHLDYVLIEVIQLFTYLFDPRIDFLTISFNLVLNFSIFFDLMFALCQQAFLVIQLVIDLLHLAYQLLSIQVVSTILDPTFGQCIVLQHVFHFRFEYLWLSYSFSPIINNLFVILDLVL